jgi:hypothetical protein
MADGSPCSVDVEHVAGTNSSTQMALGLGAGVKSSAGGTKAAADAATWGWQRLPTGGGARVVGSWPVEATTRGAGSASCWAGMALETSGRLTITRPRMAGSDLRKARVATARAAAGAGEVGGEARLAAAAGMRTAGAAASPRRLQTTPLHTTGTGGKKALRDGRI